jgi:hypothetical protein
MLLNFGNKARQDPELNKIIREIKNPELENDPFMAGGNYQKYKLPVLFTTQSGAKYYKVH